MKLNDVEVTPGGKSRKLVLRRTPTGQNFNMNWVDFEMKSTSFNLWRTKFEEFAETSPAPSGNADRDNASNGLEYAFDTDPTDSSDSPVFSLKGTGSLLEFDFRRQKFDSNLTYTPEWSRDLSNWFTTGFTEKSKIDLGSVERVTFNKSLEINQDRLFIRVKVDGL